jgi:hypothetical protein
MESDAGINEFTLFFDTLPSCRTPDLAITLYVSETAHQT